MSNDLLINTLRVITVMQLMLKCPVLNQFKNHSYKESKLGRKGKANIVIRNVQNQNITSVLCVPYCVIAVVAVVWCWLRSRVACLLLYEKIPEQLCCLILKH
uniref:Uncharacterized protein n=1 Tax=Glossina brevipalpis TaxID=37001 RepID=A0A1A9X0V3_9MUSC